MRITGGSLRSRRLFSINVSTLRPATDRLRETMFDIMANIIDIEGIRALDLYAGTGSVGFEAISRGATKVTFVESERKTADVLWRNAVALGIEENCSLRVMTVEKFLRSCVECFDVVYVDPPYALNDGTHKVVSELSERRLLKPGGIICVEHSKVYSPPRSIMLRQKAFGSTILSIIKPETVCQD